MRGMIKGVCAAAVIGSVSLSAHAGFEIVEMQPEAAMKTQPAPWVGVSSVQLIGVTQIGTPSDAQPVVKGFAKEVPLLVALKQIVPPGWKAKKSGGLDVSLPVSWKGDGRTWVEILHSLGTTYKFSAHVDWTTKELTVAAAGWKAVPADKVSQAAERNDASAEKVAAEKAQKQAASGKKGWTLQKGLSLRQNIEAWAKASNYKVSWAAVDYPIPDNATFYGNLDAPGGPLTQIVEAYRLSEQPLAISLDGDIIRVENAKKDKTTEQKAAEEAAGK